MLAAALTAIFVVAISTNLLRGRHELICGCFGRAKETISWALVMRDLAIVALALFSAKLAPTLLLLLAAVCALSTFISPLVRLKAESTMAAEPQICE